MRTVAVSPRAATVWLLALVAFLSVAADPALAQKRTPTPSAGELWQEYPLNGNASPTPEASPTAAASPTPAPSATPAHKAPAPATPASSDDNGPATGVLIFLALDALALLALAGFILDRRRRPRGRRAAPRLQRASAPLRPPPDPDRSWVAEVEWRSAGDEAHFCVVAREHPTAEGTVLEQSAPLDWPPSGPDAVAALSAAADRLAETFTRAGWTSLPTGDAWYAKRFAWEPAAAAANGPAPDAGRRISRSGMEPAWPRTTDGRWRCEIGWAPGYGRSRFEAVAYPPGDAEGHAIGASRAFDWTELDVPDPGATAHQAEVHGLVTALEAAGWRRVGQGAHWYAERFAWVDERPPPDRLEPLPVTADHGS
jgi:hypothetical protein